MLAVACAANIIAAGAAVASFTVSASGTVATRTSRLPAGRRPTAVLGDATAGSALTVTWPAVTLPSGSEVGGYLVKRTVAATNATTPLCTTTVPITTCADQTPPAGQTVTYTVTPQDQSWSGLASPPSAPISVP